MPSASNHRISDLGDLSPSFVATPTPPPQPPPQSLLSINLSVPPPTLPATMAATPAAQTPALGSTTIHRRVQSGLKRVSSGNLEAVASSSFPGALDFSRVRIDPSVDLVLKRFNRSLRSSEAQISANQAELQRLKFTEDR